jgi:hypothetical protein
MPKALQIKAGKISGERTSANAFVRFATRDSVGAALGSNMSLFEGAHIRVDRAAAPSSQAGGVAPFEPRRSVFLGNLAFDTQVWPPFFSRPFLCRTAMAMAASALSQPTRSGDVSRKKFMNTT